MTIDISDTKLAFNKEKALEVVQGYLSERKYQKELIYMIDKTVEVVVMRHFRAYLEQLKEFKSIVYTKVFKVLPHYDPKRDIFTFLYGIARNEIHNILYHVHKDAVVINTEDIGEYSEQTTLEESSSEKDLDEQDIVEFIDSIFPMTRFKLGEGLMDYLGILHQLNTVAKMEEDSLFADEEQVQKFCIFASFYLKTDSFLSLYAYYKLFSEQKNFGVVLVALSSIRSKMPNVRTIKKIIDDYILFMKKTEDIESGLAPECLDHLVEKFAVYNYTLKDVLDCLEGRKIVETSLFSKSE
jgi:hypothetical protein